MDSRVDGSWYAISMVKHTVKIQRVELGGPVPVFIHSAVS